MLIIHYFYLECRSGKVQSKNRPTNLVVPNLVTTIETRQETQKQANRFLVAANSRLQLPTLAKQSVEGLDKR